MADLSKNLILTTNGAEPRLMTSYNPNGKKISDHGKNNNTEPYIEDNGLQPRVESPHYKTHLDSQIIIEDDSRTKNDKTASNELTRSKNIHNWLQKMTKWMPNESEFEILNGFFKVNQNPSQKEKENLLHKLKETSTEKIELSQLERWFQNQRKMNSMLEKHSKKSKFCKGFSKDQLEFLNECFVKNSHPTAQEIAEIANKMTLEISKVTKWFKLTQRFMAKKDHCRPKNRKCFQKNELEYLNKCFVQFPQPKKGQIAEMAKNLNCEVSHIKNWYSKHLHDNQQEAIGRGLIKPDIYATDLPQSNGPIHYSNLAQKEASQQNPLILNLPMDQYCYSRALQNRSDEQPQFTVPIQTSNPGNATLPSQYSIPNPELMMNRTADPNIIYTVVYPDNPMHQQISSNPNNYYSSSHSQFIPLNYSYQPVMMPYYIQPQGFQPFEIPGLYQVGPQQQPQNGNWVAQSSNPVQIIPNMLMNSNLGTNMVSMSGNSTNFAHNQQDSSNLYAEDQGSKANSSRIETMPLSKLNNAGSQNLPQNQLSHSQNHHPHSHSNRFENANRVEEEYQNRGLGRMFREDNDTDASLPNEGRNLDLSREYSEGHNAGSLTTEIHSGHLPESNIVQLGARPNEHIHTAWKNPQPIYRHDAPLNQPRKVLPMQPNSTTLPQNQTPYMVNLISPCQNQPNYLPNCQTNNSAGNNSIPSINNSIQDLQAQTGFQNRTFGSTMNNQNENLSIYGADNSSKHPTDSKTE